MTIFFSTIRSNSVFKTQSFTHGFSSCYHEWKLLLDSENIQSIFTRGETLIFFEKCLIPRTENKAKYICKLSNKDSLRFILTLRDVNF